MLESQGYKGPIQEEDTDDVGYRLHTDAYLKLRHLLHEYVNSGGNLVETDSPSFANGWAPHPAVAATMTRLNIPLRY